MLRIELDRLLEYLATGEDEGLVALALPSQGDALALLSRARAAIEILSPNRIDERVQERLDRVEEMILQRARPRFDAGHPPPTNQVSLDVQGFKGPRSRRPVVRTRFLSGRSDMELASWGAGVSDSQRSYGSEPAAPPDTEERIAHAVREGDRQRVRLGADMIGPGSPGQTWVRDFGTVAIRHENRAGADVLVVEVRGADGRPVSRRSVTWLPGEGPVARATTDADGLAALPWPAPGEGILRIDADRTIEIEVRIRV